MKIVREWDGSDAPQRDFDLAIGVLGFESRSTWMLRSRSVRADRHLGLRFGYNETMHFAEAEKLYQRIHGDVILLSEHEPCRIITDYVKEHLKENAAIVVDVSAMSRLLMAKVLVALAQCTYLKRCTIYAHYVPAAFTPGTEAVPVRIAQPVVPELAGWSARPDAPLGVIAGLGYEAGAAAGALQFLEPSRAWILSPVGIDERYGPEVRHANANLNGLFDIVSLSYDLTDTVDTRARLVALTEQLTADYRLAFVPLGPKIFAWLCSLTALESRFSEVSVWRFSAQELAEAVEKEASGRSIWHAVTVEF